MRVTKIGSMRRDAPLKDRVRVYVDGSSDNRGTKTGGWAYVLLIPGRKMDVQSGAVPAPTNNQITELMAALHGLGRSRKETGGQVEVISDSRYVVKGITEYLPVWKIRDWVTTGDEDVKHRELWEQLDALDGPDVIWTHIRGHQGNVYNELADRAADQARRSQLLHGG